MANEINLIVGSEAIKGLDSLIEKLGIAHEGILKISQDSLTLNKNLNVKSPSGLNEHIGKIKELTESLRLQSESIIKLQNQIDSLTKVRQKSNQQTVQESVNNGILTRQARQHAIINSTLAGSYQRLSAEQAKSATNVQNLIARGKLATQTQDQYNKELKQAQNEFEKLNKRVLLADSAVGRFNRNVGNYPAQAAKGIKDLIGAFGVIGGVTLIAGIAKDIFNTTKELQSLDLALKQVTGSNEIFSQSQQFLKRVSEDYGIEIKGLTQQYTQFYVSAKDKISGKKIQDIFESISKSAGFMGLSVDAQRRAFLALNQMMSKGTVSAEELKGQLGEALPGAFGIMAKSMNVTEKELGKLMKDGKVMASEVLPEFAKQLEITYGIQNKDRVESLSASVTRLSNYWTDFVRTMNSGSGILSKSLIFLLDSLGKVTVGLDYMIKSAKEARLELNKDIENKGYKGTLEYLDQIKNKQEQIKNATDLKAEGQRRINDLAEQNKWLNSQYVTLAKIEKMETGVIGRVLGLPKTASKELKALNDKIKENTNSIYFNKGQIAASNEVLNENTDIQGKSNIALDDKIRKLKTLADLEIKQADFYASDYALRKKLLENSRDNNKLVFEDENKNFQQRSDAYDKMMQAKRLIANEAYAEEQRLINKEEKDLTKDIRLKYEGRLNDVKELENDKNVIYRDGANDRAQALLEKENAETALTNDFLNKRKLATQNYTQSQIDLANEYANEVIPKLSKKIKFEIDENAISQGTLDRLIQYRDFIESFNGTTSLREFEDASKAKTRITADETEAQLVLQIAKETNLLKLSEGNVEQYEIINKRKIALEIQLANIKIALEEKEAERLKKLKEEQLAFLDSFSQSWDSVGFKSLDFFTKLDKDGKTAFENLVLNAETSAESIGVAINSISEVFQDAMNLMDQANETRYQNEIKRLDNQKELSIGYAGESATAKAEIERQYEEKRKRLDRERAEQKKKQALYNALIDTAQAVITGFIDSGYVGAIFAAALGAAQIAIISSQEIPAYFEGGTHDGGKMLVNDAKGSSYKETIVLPNGNILKPQSRNVLMDAPKGTEIYTPEQWHEMELNNMLERNGINQSVSINNSGINKEDFDAGINKLYNRESFSITRDINGERIFKHKQGQKTELLNNHLHIKPFNV